MSADARPTGGAPSTAVALWRLARPAGMPLVLGLPLVGYGFGHWDFGLDARNVEALPVVLIAWFLLSAGTLWLNAALDRDDGELLMGPTTTPPPGIERWAAAALLSAVAVGSLAGPAPGLITLACALLAVLYSAPATAWKGHPVLGPVVNVVGYGLCSPLVGWWVVDVPVTARGLATWGLLGAWVAATYFGAQAFQEEEDRRRGYRTLVATHGARAAVRTTRVLYALTLGGTFALCAAGAYPRLVLLALPVAAWFDRHLASWSAEPERGAVAGREMLRRATILALTLIALATAQHAWDILHGRPPAGLGTALAARPLRGGG